jgi:hypothetical protein
MRGRFTDAPAPRVLPVVQKCWLQLMSCHGFFLSVHVYTTDLLTVKRDGVETEGAKGKAV